MKEYAKFENDINDRLSKQILLSDMLERILGTQLYEICALSYELSDKQKNYIAQTIRQVLKHNL